MRRGYFLAIFFVQSLLFAVANCAQLRWAADTESGAPNVFYEDGDLDRLVGFEKDVIEAVAQKIGDQPIFVPNDWSGLIPGLQRGLYDVVINGITPSEARKHDVLFSNHYYACQLALVVRDDDDTISSVLDCNNRKVGVLEGAGSEVDLQKNLRAVEIVSYANEHCAITGLMDGRVDAVVLDAQIAAYYSDKIPHLRIVDYFGNVRYSIAIALKNKELLAAVNRALAEMKNDGTLRAIISKWHLSNENCERIVFGDDQRPMHRANDAQNSPAKSVNYRSMAALFARGACVTIGISVCSMCVAVCFGLGLAIMRVHMPRPFGLISVVVIELLRGTPLLIQLFLIFYGLPCIGITLRPVMAGILTLGINYAAYEAENFRAGMLAVPGGQVEAARALGMNQWQSLRYVILPQAFTFILPPLTNDFISLIKDSSLVSLITIIELTKAYTMSASSTFNFFIPGIIVALIYFFIGFPFVRLARWAEKHLKLEKRAYFSKKSKGTN